MEALMSEAHLTALDLTVRLDLAIATVKRIMRDLKSDGSLKREGSDKTGRWIVIRADDKNPSMLNSDNKN